MTPTSDALKQEGNRHFKGGDFTAAEAFYSKAIIADPKEPTLYTNRAMARLKMDLWDFVIEDCNECLKLSPVSMKAHYYLGQAYLALKDYNDALDHAMKAHQLCQDKSLDQMTQLVLKCKKERWEDMERRRKREGTELEGEILAMLEKERDQALRDLSTADEGDRHEIAEECDHKMQSMKVIFEKARAAEEKKRVVPDWVIDDISFGIMVDPVVTKTGKSYEKASIVEHLRRQQTDPITREPLHATDLRPNVDLRKACAEFLDENGWAVDW